PHQRRIDGALIQQYLVSADLLDATRNSISVQRAHRCQRLQDHQVQCPLQKIEFRFAHPHLLWHYHITISHLMWEHHRKRQENVKFSTGRRLFLLLLPFTQQRMVQPFQEWKRKSSIVADAARVSRFLPHARHSWSESY